ncbi:MAG: hypothetical protein COW02_17965 [Comamonadaceae bacterium CG12_big_fil_rev_8_21_14_0_65_59_15]|nr:MAG: hypothetical protein COW02_17965 [Comamonadaceae bacterium CG12_big_fil_rev_8_21_14_0_65_59_15]
MKNKQLLRHLFLGLLLAGSTAAHCATPGGPGSGMLGTAHDFTIEGQHQPISGMPIGLCSVCHTPHSAISTQLLWNQKLTTQNYTWGDATATTGGTLLPSSAHLGPSTKCLSCHDGTVAVGDTANYNGSVRGVDATNPLGTLVVRIGGGVNGIGQQGNVKGTMQGNHPIAVPYPLNGGSSRYNGIDLGGQVDRTSFVASPAAPIKLYNDDGSGHVSIGAVAGKTGIECTSCHDPHNKQATDDFFLRGKNQGSSLADGYICLQCHIK